MNYSNLVDSMLAAIPEVRPRFDEGNSWWDEILPHIVFGDVVVPVVIEWLSEYQTKNSELIRAFSFFEEMATSGDKMVEEVLGVTVLEQLGDGRSILQVARTFMGNQTRELSDNIEKGLGRM